MYIRPTIFPGVLVATLLSGPIGTLYVAVAIIFGRWPGFSDLNVFLFILVFSFPIGVLASFLPNLVGAALLSHLGWSYEIIRRPLIWFATGGLAGAALGVAVNGGVGAPGLILWFVAMGASCALLCRRGTRWD